MGYLSVIKEMNEMGFVLSSSFKDGIFKVVAESNGLSYSFESELLAECFCEIFNMIENK